MRAEPVGGREAERTNVFLILLVLAGFLTLSEALGEHGLLEVGRRAVKDIHGLQADFDHAEGAVEEADEVRRGLAVGRHERHAVLSDRDEELVQAH